jgi:hypothetical protein
MLYSKNNQYPKPIPFRIVLSDGRTRTDPSTFTEDEIVDAGYVAVDNPPNITSNEVLSWNGELLRWEVRDKTAEELEAEKQRQWVIVRNQRDKMLSEIDWKYIRHASETRLGLTPTDNLNSLDIYAQALRDITTQEDPYNIVWPIYGEETI